MNSRTVGLVLEEALEWQHNIYANTGRATIYHSGTRATMHGGAWIPEASAVDFTGTLSGGRHVLYDSKHVGTLTYTHSRRQLHQLMQLWDHAQMGALCFLLVAYQMERFWLLWPQPSWQFGSRYSVRLTEITPSIGVEFEANGGYELPDWLSVVEAQGV